jgi:hypothetical protein
MAFGSQNLLMGAGLVGVSMALTAVIVPHVHQAPVEARRAGASQEAAVAVPKVPEAPPPERTEQVAELRMPPVPIEAPLAVAVPPEPAPLQEARIPDPVPAPAPVEAPAAAAVTPPPDIRVASPDDTPMGCLPAGLKGILDATARRFGYVEVVSTTHLHTDNMAADIKTPADPAEVIAFVRTLPGLGGIGTYRNGVIHLDDASAHPQDAYAKRQPAQ